MVGAWECAVCFIALGMHDFPEFFTPAFTSTLLYTPIQQTRPRPHPLSHNTAIHPIHHGVSIQLYSVYIIHPDTVPLWMAR